MIGVKIGYYSLKTTDNTLKVAHVELLHKSNITLIRLVLTTPGLGGWCLSHSAIGVFSDSIGIHEFKWYGCLYLTVDSTSRFLYYYSYIKTTNHIKESMYFISRLNDKMLSFAHVCHAFWRVYPNLNIIEDIKQLKKKIFILVQNKVQGKLDFDWRSRFSPTGTSIGYFPSLFPIDCRRNGSWLVLVVFSSVWVRVIC